MALSNRLAIASVSLGQHTSHTLSRKIAATAEAGIQGIEITWPDLEDYATSLSLNPLQAAPKIRQLCKESDVHIIALASFQNFEGQRTPLSRRLQKAREWLAVAHALGAEHLQVPSNYDQASNGDHDTIVSEFRQLSHLANSYNPAIKIAYENLAWGIHCYEWQHALKVVQAVDQDNFGLCLDSFHLVVSLWADPFRADGRQPNGDQKLRESLRALVTELPLAKLFYLQLSDGERLSPPYSKQHPWFDHTLAPAHVWSNEARPFPLEIEYGAYMPVLEVIEAFLLDLRFTGWVSFETFDRRMKVEAENPLKNAKRARASWERLGNGLVTVRSKKSKV